MAVRRSAGSMLVDISPLRDRPEFRRLFIARTVMLFGVGMVGSLSRYRFRAHRLDGVGRCGGRSGGHRVLCGVPIRRCAGRAVPPVDADPGRSAGVAAVVHRTGGERRAVRRGVTDRRAGRHERVVRRGRHHRATGRVAQPGRPVEAARRRSAEHPVVAVGHGVLAPVAGARPAHSRSGSVIRRWPAPTPASGWREARSARMWTPPRHRSP